MIISVNWLREYTNISLPIEDLATLIGARLVEIEGIESLNDKYKDVVIVKVVECKDVEDSDHLHVTRIDDGGVMKDVERGEDGLVQVVCGAPNVRAGMYAAWLPPQSVVPETYGTDDPFVLGARQLRGLTSNGMLASAKELDLYEDHEGIVELPEMNPGKSFSSAFYLDDYLLDIENKSLTHRPDTFGIIGFAREVAAIQGEAFKTPEWMMNPLSVESTESIEAPKVTIDNAELSARYQAVVMTGAKELAKTPFMIQTLLARSGVRPISPIVDVTNYLMLLTGQPLHAFDYDKLVKVGGGKVDIHVRNAKKGETLKLLDGRTVELDVDDIVIANGDTAIGLAGAMGGADTEIDETTTRIIIESATFNLYNLRTTQMRHGIFSEAITRFTKGQPAELTAPVLSKAVQLISEITGAVAASPVADEYPGESKPEILKITTSELNSNLGSEFTTEEVIKTLRNVEFNVEDADGELSVTAPYWRSDIHIAEDLYEEVGRINSYDNILPTLPRRDFVAVAPDDFDRLRRKIRDLLTRAGANEVLTYSFVHGDVMRKAGQDPEGAYRLVNSLSPDLQYYRQSLTPSLLANIHPNIKSGYDHFALFELNKFHTKKAGLNDEDVPKELDGLAFVISNNNALGGASYYEAKRYLDFLANSLNLDLVYEPLEENSDYPVTQPFEPKRSARVWDRKTRERIGVVGEFKRSVAKSFKLPEATAGFELATRGLLKLAKQSEYMADSKYPTTDRDVSFQIQDTMTFDELFTAIKEAVVANEGDIRIISSEPLSIYRPEEETYRNITVRFVMTNPLRTITAEDANKTRDAIIKQVIEKTQAVIV